MALSMLAIAGEEAWSFASNLLKLGDGSFIAVSLDKPSYNAGETMTGKVVAQIMSPVVCDEVALKMRLKEKVTWDDEHSRTEWVGEGEERRANTIWEHHERTGKKTLFKQTIKISDIDHTLPPGVWVYPFSIQIPPSVPGVTKHKRKVDSNDPAWRSAGRKCETKFESVFTVKAVLQTKGVFSKDLKSRQELVVNPFFDWSKMAPAKADKSGTVMLCCCIPRGMVHLTSTYDKAAFQAGETMRVSATIKNESKSNVKEMISRLNRFITITDGHGNRKTFHDEVAKAKFPGVAPGETAVREMPLTLVSSAGPLIPSIKTALIEVAYRFDCECSIDWAPDIEAQIPVVIYQPSPVSFGLGAAFGGTPLPPAVQAALMASGGAGAGAGAMPHH